MLLSWLIVQELKHITFHLFAIYQNVSGKNDCHLHIFVIYWNSLNKHDYLDPKAFFYWFSSDKRFLEPWTSFRDPVFMDEAERLFVLGLDAVQILKIIDEQPLEHFGSAIEPKRIVLALSGNRTSGNEACLEHLNLLESTWNEIFLFGSDWLWFYYLCCRISTVCQTDNLVICLVKYRKNYKLYLFRYIFRFIFVVFRK